MQRERPRSAQGFGAMPFLHIGRLIRRGRLLVIRIIQTRPLLFLSIPPDELLSFTPWLSVGAGGRSVVDDAAVVGPRESPAVAQQIFRLPLQRPVIALFRIYAAIDPGSARGRSIVL